MNKVIFTLVAPLMITGCMGSTPPKPSSCKITTTSSASVDQNAAINLTAFGKRPAGTNFRHDLASEFNKTFNSVSNSKAKCQMLTQLASCYSNKSEARNRVIELKEKTKVCG